MTSLSRRDIEEKLVGRTIERVDFKQRDPDSPRWSLILVLDSGVTVAFPIQEATE